MYSITELLNTFNQYSKTNQIVAGAMSLWGLGMITWVCRSIPAKIFQFLKRQLTTTLSLTNSGVGTNCETFGSFMKWFESEQLSRWSRSFSLNGVYYANDEEGTVLGMGDGNHFFIYRGKPFWLTRTRIQQGTTYALTYEVVITGLGRSTKYIRQMIEEFKYRPSQNKLGIFAFENRTWNRVADIPKRGLQTVIIDPVIKEQIVSMIQQFTEDRTWYESRGLPYKKTVVLHGIPGTGKTSLIKALASHFQMNLCLVNLQHMTDQSLELALAVTPPKTIVVIEDFDSATVTKTRTGLKKDKPAPPVGAATVAAPDSPVANVPTSVELNVDLGSLTLSGVLNALDGIMSLDGKMIFMTTNVYDTLDPALLRKGRIDVAYELKPLTHTEVLGYIRLMFPDYEFAPNRIFSDILGCDLQDLYFQNREDVKAFIASIPKEPRVTLHLYKAG